MLCLQVVGFFVTSLSLSSVLYRLDADGQSDPQKVGFEEGEQASPSTSESGLYSPPMVSCQLFWSQPNQGSMLQVINFGI